MRKLLLLATCLSLLFSSNIYAQNWCWPSDITGLGECGGDQNACADGFGNLYTFTTGPAILTFGSAVITGNYRYIVKHRVADGSVAWIKGSIGSMDEYFDALQTDANGNLYIYYDSSGTTFTYCNITKLDSFGNVVWRVRAHSFGSSVIEPKSITYDNAGHIYVSGHFYGAGGVTEGADTLINVPCDTSGYVIKYDTLGNVLWMKLLSSPHYVYSPYIVSNKNGDLFVSAFFNAGSLTLLDTTVSVPSGPSEFVARFDSSLHLKWITPNRRNIVLVIPAAGFLQGEWSILGADDGGNAYLAGAYYESDTLGTTPVTYDADHNQFVAKYRNTDGAVTWVQTGGNSGDRKLYGYAANGAGNSYLLYMSNATTTYFGDSTFTYAASGPLTDNVAIIAFDGSGKITCGTLLGGTTGDDQCGITIDKSGFAYVVGDFTPLCQFGDTTIYASGEEYFAAKYSCHCTCGVATLVDSATIAVSPGDTVCPGSAVTFAVTTSGGGPVAFQWLVNGMYVGTGDSTFTYTPAEGDSVRCLVSADLCSIAYTISSQTIKMHVLSAEGYGITITAVPGDTVCIGDTIHLAGTTNWSSTTPAYQWSNKGVTVGTGSTLTYVPANGDSLWCVISVCSPAIVLTSNAIKVVVKNCKVNLPGITNNTPRIYPNPANDQLFIQPGSASFSFVTITNTVGEVITQQPIVSPLTVVKVSALPPGIYFATLRGADGSLVQKFVKE